MLRVAKYEVLFNPGVVRDRIIMNSSITQSAEPKQVWDETVVVIDAEGLTIGDF